MIKKILIGGFWALVLLPNLLFMLAGGKGDGGGTENRTLAEFPVFEADTYETFPSAVDSYINDHAAFRNRFLSANSVLNLKLFGYDQRKRRLVFFCRRHEPVRCAGHGALLSG